MRISILSPFHGRLIERRTALYGAHVSRAASAVAAVGAVALAASAAAAPRVVLGSTKSFQPYEKGWGTARPAIVNNGGDPSGEAWNLRWSGWGAAIASAQGSTYVMTKLGWQKGKVEFRASRIARCTRLGPLAYTRLQVRVAPVHGAFSRWQLWNGRPNLCHY
jgi:hypothetical protein